jgi:hypothetical protein
MAVLYGVQTKEINHAVKNNPAKFPLGYIFEFNNQEFASLQSKFLTVNLSKTRVIPKVFTEKGLYMLATILESKRTTQITIDIVETYAKLRELSRTVSELVQTTKKPKQKSLMQKSGDFFFDLLDDGMQTSGTETTFEINFAVMKFKHTIKQERRK